MLSYWFGGGHPSALVSNTIRDGMKEHFVKTFTAAEILFGRPLVIKNAWNCFRIEFLAQALPRSRFIWIRRDVAAAAKSDLSARYQTKGDPAAWNSATPANVDKLRRLPPIAQVVENQYAFDRAISRALDAQASHRWAQLWYEDFRASPEATLEGLAKALDFPKSLQDTKIAIEPSQAWVLSKAEEDAIDAYVENCRVR